MLRFLLTRRWIGLLAAVLVVGAACIWLGQWQLDRYDERRDANLVTEANLDAEPVPVAEVLSVDEEVTAADEWRVVQATGRYDVSEQLRVLYRTKDGAPGVDVVIPLVTESGTALIVDRGWVPTEANAQKVRLPAPPPGTVTVTGWTRVDAEGGSDEIEPVSGGIRAISSDAISETLPYPAYDGFVDLTREEPSAQPAPAKADGPDLGSGPHFFYGIQWFFFAGLALAFWCYFAWVEYRDRRGTGDPARREPSRAPQHTA